MKSIKDVQYLISETTREADSLKKSITEANKLIISASETVADLNKRKVKSFKKELKAKLDRIGFYRDIILYLESESREVYLKEQVEKLSYRIGQVDEKIAILEATSKAAQALANQKKSLKAEFNYDKHKKQLEVIQFILN